QIAWRPDGKRLAYTVYGDTKVHLIDLATRAAATLTGHTNGVRAVAWSADGEHIATGADDATLRVWDEATAAEVQRVAQLAPVDAIAWSPDGAHLATAGASTIDVLDAASGERIGGVTDATAKALAWSPDGKQLAYGGATGGVGRYDVATGAHSAWLATSARAIAWSGQGRIA